MTPQLTRPVPTPSALTEEFWQSARDGVLVRPVCDECGRSFFTPQVICPHCLGEQWTYQRSSGHGTVYSSTVVHRAPSPELSVPYELALVDVEEGWSMLANIVNDSSEPTAVGTAVEVTWITIEAGFVLPAFRVHQA